MTMEITQGNISTLAAWIYDIIGPTYLVTYGIDQGTFTILMIILVGIIINIWSSYHPNTITWLGNTQPNTETIDEPVLNEYDEME